MERCFGDIEIEGNFSEQKSELRRLWPHMLAVKREGARGPLLVMLHWLGGGAQTWTEISHGLAARGVRCVAVDLPGFGGSAGIAGYDVKSMAEAVTATIEPLLAGAGADEPAPWFLAGHSMGGKVASVIARRALDGRPSLQGLQGFVLVSASPPGPEPMSDSKRAAMLKALGETTGDQAKDRKHAAQFVDENTGKLPLPEAVRERAIRGVLHMNRTAFRCWLEHGSNEDWRKQVGVLALPALVFAGTEDEALGPKAQKNDNLPHLPQGELVVLEGAGHLAPLERPGELVEYITQFMAGAGATLAVTQAAPGIGFETVLQSERTAPITRAVMQTRLRSAQNWNHSPLALSFAEFRTLRTLVARVVPDAGFDIAAQLDSDLATGKGDGWRFANLPPDAKAWQLGLRSLDFAATKAYGVPFAALFHGQQDDLLQHATAGKLGHGVLGALHLGEAAGMYNAEQMKRWFSDVRSECTRCFVADPRTMERIGYTGFADDLGFTQIQLSQQEEFGR